MLRSVFLGALAEPLQQPGKRRVLLHFYPQVTHTGIVQQLAAAVIDLELTCPQDLECLLERLRSLALTSTNTSTLAACATGATLGSRAFYARLSAGASGSRRGC